jgi:hypothetical protein
MKDRKLMIDEWATEEVVTGCAMQPMSTALIDPNRA